MGKPLLYNTGLRYNAQGLVYGGSQPDSPTIKHRKTTSMTTTEIYGFTDAVNQAMSTDQAELLTKGLTVAPWLTQGATLKTDAITKNNAQEAAKAALRTQTVDADAALQALYDFYSSKLDAMASAYGKTTPKAKELLRLRSDIRRGPNPAKAQAKA